MPLRIDELISPYNFVPPPNQRVWPGWAAHVSHDRPFRDGISGTLEIKIKADTALFIGGGPIEGPEKTPVETFYRDGHGKYAIPGTSLRGMLRSVVEIASFGRLGPVNDLKLGFRDLQHRDYTNAMNGKVNAGWLVRERGKWRIEACHYAKVDYDYIERLGGSEFVPGKKQGAHEKYAAFQGSLEGSFGLRPPPRMLARPVNPDGKVPIVSEYMEVDPRAPGSVHGTLVFTGQPMSRLGNEPRRKHSDFFFYGDAGWEFRLEDQQRTDFEFIHSDGKQQGKDSPDPSPEWAYWKKKGEKTKVPVFFLLERDPTTRKPRVRAFGLAGMFRLAADQRISDVVQRAQAGPKRVSEGEDRGQVEQWPDLAETIFGYVSKGEDAVGAPRGALRGRVSVGIARVNPLTASTAPEPVEAVFGVPKPSFYPHYLLHGRKPMFDAAPEEERLRSERTKLKWHTYMSPSATARGWKRYVIRRSADRKPFIPAKVKEEHLSRFVPLEKGATFTAKIRVHNLRPMELGALVWALDFGGNPKARHRLGRARPLGFGTVKVTPGTADLTRLSSNEAVTLEGLRAAFTEYMQGQTDGRWATSRTIFELTRLAEPLSEDESKKVDYPRLDPERRINQFTDIKKRGPALQPVGGKAAFESWTGVTAAPGVPEAEWPDATRASGWIEGGPTKLDTGDKDGAKQGNERPEKTAPEAPAKPAVVTEGWVLAGFSNVIQARDRRKQIAKDRKKRKAKTRALGIRLEDGRVLEVDGALLSGIDEVFAVLASNGGVAFDFRARLEAGRVVQVDLEAGA